MGVRIRERKRESACERERETLAKIVIVLKES